MSTSSVHGGGHKPEPILIPIPVTKEETILSTPITEGVTVASTKDKEDYPNSTDSQA